MDKVKQTLQRIRTLGTAAIMTGLSAFPAFADDPFDLSYLTDGSTDQSMFEDITDTAKEIFASGYGLIIVVCTAVAVISLIMIGLKFFMGERMRIEAKDAILWFLVGCLCIFAAVPIVTIIISAAGNIGS